MKRYIPYILAFLALSCIVSCATNDEIANPADGGHMTLRLVSSTMTRAEGDLDNSRNEDKLVTADLYFYSADAQGNAKWHHHIDFTDTYDSATVNDINLSAEVMNQVFGTGTEGQLYVIANYSGATALPTTANIGESGIPNSSIAELQKYSLTTSFGPASSNATWADQTSFVMDGQGKIEKNGSDVAGTISLTRAAAKIELSISGFVEEAVKDANGNEWTPNFKVDGSIEAYVKLINGVGSSYVGGSELLKPYTYDKTTATDGYYGFNAPTAGTTIYPQKNPFYSYSSDWSANGEANKASLLLVVPWKRTSDEYVDNCYYEIPIGSRDNVTIDRNKYYQISIFVGTLGSFEESENVELTPNITVVDWSTGSIEADINEARYLVVDETEVEIYNKNEYRISFSASHPENTTVNIVSVTRDDLKGNKADTTTFYSNDSGTKTISAGKWDNSNTYKLMKDCSVMIDGDKIVFSHDLVNSDEDRTSNADGYPTDGNYRNIDDYDFTPYYITLEVKMTAGNNTFIQQVNITQYPQVYIKASQNSDYDGGGNASNNADRNTMVNGYYSENSQYSYIYKVNTNQSTFGTVPGLVSNADNQNPNMYVVTITSISSDSPYIIGDPRQSVIDTDLVNATSSNRSIWVNTVALYDGPSRTLKYYYPTDRTMIGDDDEEPADYATGYMIAPKFRVASSYSVTHGPLGSVDEAERRCASYQEDGYPAGRWRLPTYAEAAFIVGLSNEKKIPYLFNTNTYYWCAHGQFKPSTTGVDLDNGDDAFSVRCVYDEWYWGNEQLTNKSTFTWGDEPR